MVKFRTLDDLDKRDVCVLFDASYAALEKAYHKLYSEKDADNAEFVEELSTMLDKLLDLADRFEHASFPSITD